MSAVRVGFEVGKSLMRRVSFGGDRWRVEGVHADGDEVAQTLTVNRVGDRGENVGHVE